MTTTQVYPDQRVLRRTVKVFFDPPEPIEGRWTGAKLRLMTEATVSFIDTTIKGVESHDTEVHVWGRYKLKNGEIGTTTWHEHLWNDARALHTQVVQIAREALNGANAGS